MGCNCIEIVEERLRKKTGDDEAFMRVMYDIKAKERYIPIEAYYRSKIGGLIFKKKLSLAHLVPDYCPFCGKKRNDGEADYMASSAEQQTAAEREARGD